MGVRVGGGARHDVRACVRVVHVSWFARATEMKTAMFGHRSPFSFKIEHAVDDVIKHYFGTGCVVK